MAELTEDQRRQLESLRHAYEAELPEKVRSIARAAAFAGLRNWEPAEVQELHRLVHRLAGSAAIWGFTAVSRTAGLLEEVVMAAMGGLRRRRRCSSLPSRAWWTSSSTRCLPPHAQATEGRPVPLVGTRRHTSSLTAAAGPPRSALQAFPDAVSAGAKFALAEARKQTAATRASARAVEGRGGLMRGMLKATAYVLTVLLCVVSASAASAQVTVPITVTGDVASGVIALPGGFGAELTLTFEDVVGLHPGALEVTATVVDPADPALRARLPGLPLPPWLPQPVNIPAAFPVLVRVSPTASSALSFSGLYNISFYTHNLQLDPNVPLALFKSHDGGPFSDIMVTEGIGSYRAGGGGGDFSEFLIVVDRRLINTVILDKFATLTLLLTEHALAIPPAILTSLLERLALARTLFLGGGTLAALAEIVAFFAGRARAQRRGDPERLAGELWRRERGGPAPVGGGHAEVQPGPEGEPLELRSCRPS